MGAERAEKARQKMLRIAQVEGIRFRFGGRLGGSTRDAHVLLKMAEGKGPETVDRVVEGLFEAFHEKEEDVADRSVVLKIGADCGLDVDEMKAYLTDRERIAQVDAEAQAARDGGIKGVPHFLIQGRHVLDGAQDAGDFLEVFSKIKEEEG